MNVDEEEGEEKPEEETFRREVRQKKRQEQVEEGQSFGSKSQLMDMIASLQASMNSRFDALDGKISDIQEKVIYKEAKDHKTTRFYEDEVIKLKTLKKEEWLGVAYKDSIKTTSKVVLHIPSLSMASEQPIKPKQYLSVGQMEHLMCTPPSLFGVQPLPRILSLLEELW
ncbi:hypothetical protein M9H77_23289 [Catharanthus roseus]|uniref:Uncharacterized protein n=1 Tax=Catharanthus roseus TaxID=4058 RepID=A0ACC0ATL5_CATRO|nr:hypothetical protein M9H77_23289 [Catharanthus roseus]